jgi:hypothetical protein
MRIIFAVAIPILVVWATFYFVQTLQIGCRLLYWRGLEEMNKKREDRGRKNILPVKRSEKGAGKNENY